MRRSGTLFCGKSKDDVSSAHQRLPREDLQQGDQVMSIPKVFVQICDVTLRLQEHRQTHNFTLNSSAAPSLFVLKL